MFTKCDCFVLGPVPAGDNAVVGASCNDPARVTDMVIGETVGPPPVLTDPDWLSRDSQQREVGALGISGELNFHWEDRSLGEKTPTFKSQ